MTMKLPLGNKKNATLISAYAPTMTNPEETKDKFNEELDALIAAVPQLEKLIVLGDFNARVGTDHQTWDRVIGKHGAGKCNSNGLLLLKTCASHDLAITHTMFRLPTRNKTAWMHPRSRHWHLIDYLIVRARDRRDVRLTKAVCGADCWTDHRLIISKLNLHIQPMRRPQGQKVAKRLNITKLKCIQTAPKLHRALNSKLADTQSNQDSIEEQWALFRDTVHSVAHEVLGPATRNHQD